MRQIDLLFTEYGESHQNATNKAIHWVCVPLIFFSIVCLIWAVPAGPLQALGGASPNPFFNWATLILGLVLVYYLSLSVALFFGMAIFAGLCLLGAYWLEVYTPWPLWVVGLIIFFAAWAGQFYGHKIEGKKPSFFKDLQFLLIGPAWLMHFLYRKMGLRY